MLLLKHVPSEQIPPFRSVWVPCSLPVIIILLIKCHMNIICSYPLLPLLFFSPLKCLIPNYAYPKKITFFSPTGTYIVSLRVCSKSLAWTHYKHAFYHQLSWWYILLTQLNFKWLDAQEGTMYFASARAPRLYR